MAKDGYGKDWIIPNALAEISRYAAGVLTIRGLHYRLVSRGMPNTMNHYKRVVNSMIDARWDGLVGFETFSDRDRSMVGETKAEPTNLEDKITKGKEQVEAWINNYYKNRWENQSTYVEVFIEKKALEGVFAPVCDQERVALGACKGYPSLTFLNDTADRLLEAEQRGQFSVILYFGDYDPSGEDIPRSIEENLARLGCEDFMVKRIALLRHQVEEWNLPPAPAKSTDSRTKNASMNVQIELDAVEPNQLQRMCREAILAEFDTNAYAELIDQEEEEREQYIIELKDYVKNL